MAEATVTSRNAGSGGKLPAALEAGVRDFRQMPSSRQMGALALGAAGLVLMAFLLIWAMRPTYAPLVGALPAGEASEVLRVLSQAGVPYRVDGATQAIEVPASRVAEARLIVAEQGLPSRGDFGFELLQQDSGFGASRLVEGARFHRAIEGELARTIASLAAVESARVHIARAERSVFIRERRPATASVVVQLARGEHLGDRQVNAIVHLVASSVPELEPDQVTVVDQQGRLLTIDDPMTMAGGEDQLRYQRRVESGYVERVLALLEPIYGVGRVRVQVATDIDFSRIERTEERFDPESSVVRSEQLRDEERVGVDGLTGGIPGALTNQPPAGGAIENEAPGDAPIQRPGARITESTRNFEIDRSIAHVREMPGAVRRVSTAVVIDFTEVAGADGVVLREARAAEELDQLRALVQEAVGFSAARGDTIQVVSAPFSLEEQSDFVTAPPIWQQPWFVELIKVAIAALVALVVLLTVVRPVVKQMLAPPASTHDEQQDGQAPALANGAATPALTMEPSAVGALTGPKGPDQQELDLEAVREMVREDPRRVAQVLKEWVGNGDGR